MEHKSKKFSSEFNKMKSLVGTWQGEMKRGDKNMVIKINYKVSSGGSSIVETSFPGTPMEMVSVYTDVKGKVNMTHYCALQNQPTLKLQSSTKDTLDFNYIKGTNLDAKKDAYMQHLTLKFKDKNTIEQHWTQYKGGKSAGINKIVLTRVN
jgi:hypothetical protein